MDTAVTVVLGAIGIAFAVGNIAYWKLVMTRGHERFRRYCERRYGVAIGTGHKGHWQVGGDGGPWYRRLGIELLQLGYFMGAFVAWAVGLVGLFAVMKALSP